MGSIRDQEMVRASYGRPTSTSSATTVVGLNHEDGVADDVDGLHELSQSGERVHVLAAKRGRFALHLERYPDRRRPILDGLHEARGGGARNLNDGDDLLALRRAAESDGDLHRGPHVLVRET